MSALEGNPSGTDSRSEAGSAAGSAPGTGGVEASSAALSAPAAWDDAVGGSDRVLQPPSKAEATINGGNGRCMTVTLEPPGSGKRKLTAWCWRFVSRFTPSIDEKNVVCLVRSGDGTPCHHLMKWSGSGDNNRGTGTSGLSTHIENKHPDKYEEAMKELGTSQKRRAPVAAAAIGEEFDEN